MKRLQLACTVAVFLIVGATASAGSIVIQFDPGTPVTTNVPLTGFATTGDIMEGMSVTALFDNASSQTVPWVATGVGSGAASGSGWSLSAFGDTIIGIWSLSNTSPNGLTRITIDGAPGSTLFDTTFGGAFGTAGSGAGRTFEAAGGDYASVDVTVTYRDLTGIDGADPVGDLFRGLDIQFTNVGGLLSGMSISYIADSDHYDAGGDITPIPQCPPEVEDTVAPLITCPTADPVLVTGDCPTECPDIINNDAVDVDDLIAVILSWGDPGCGGSLPCCADRDGNGAVDVDDLISVIIGWGPCAVPINFCSGPAPDLVTGATVSDNCDKTVTVTQDPVAGATLTFGENIITLTATDDAGNESECTRSVQVVDSTAPLVGCPADIVQTADGPSGAIVVFSVIALDTCDPSPSVQCVPASGTLFACGTTPVTCTVTDASGNAEVCGFQVTVTDCP